jgi:general secretion pathway protein J
MRARSRGFTLVELLVALVAMALLAMLSWRGLDGMVRAQEQTRTRADEVQALQTGLAQWTADLDALVQLPLINAIDWNGRALRLTRTVPGTNADGVVVVGWARRTQAGASQWMRWQSPLCLTRGQVEDALRRADSWAQQQSGATAGGGNEVGITGLVDWQVFYYRSDAWTNPLSSDATRQPAAGTALMPVQTTTTGPRTAVIPDGVRIVLDLAPGQAISGELMRDWVRPTVGGGKSS